MSEYIDREKIIEMCKRMISEKWNSKIAPVSWSCAYADFIDYVEDIPAEGVAPVVHGKWIFHEKYGRLITHKCSICGQIMTTNGNFMNYCPKCGAKMDGEK